jgi:hypothetical protein
MPPLQVKVAVRGRKKDWFEAKDGPRGWIVGPFICLWMSVLDRHGPMLFGRIQQDEFGSRVSGRAGSDLNGVAALALWLPLMLFVIGMALRADQLSLGHLAIFGTIIALSPLAFWISDKDKKQAQPLVRFIRNTITPGGQSLRAKVRSSSLSSQIRMTVTGEELKQAPTAEAVHDALLNLGVGDSVVLAKAAEDYIQTLLQNDGFVLEQREGSADRHYKAVASGKPVDEDGRSLFTFEETLAAVVAYGSNLPMPQFIRWQPMLLVQ